MAVLVLLLLGACSKREESWSLVVNIMEIMVKQTASVEGKVSSQTGGE